MRTTLTVILTCAFVASIANAFATILAETIANVTTVLAHATF